MILSRTTVPAILFAFVLNAVPALAASPRLSLVLPRGVQRGAEHELDFRGRNLQDAEEILFYEPGIEVTKIEPVDDRRVKVQVKVAGDCALGEHTVQVRTRSGVSDYRTFYVGALPAVDEKEPNSEFEQPQPISLGVTVQGVVQNEDVDYYAVEAKKGQRIVAEIEAIRLGTYLFDPHVSILDEKRFELSAADDTPLTYQDGVASIVAPADGKYFVAVREAAYGGNGNCRYRLHVGSFPRPLAVYPAGGRLGEEVEVRYIGDPAGDVTAKVQLPEEPQADFGLFASDANGIAPSANPFRLFPHGNDLEVEPNDSREQATPATLPNAFNGIIQKEGDRDFFRFAAKKGQTYEVECYARRIRSPLDPVMAVYGAEKGNRIAADDDSRGPDSHFRFKAPADGDYVLMVRDHLDRGGAEFVYRVEFQPVEPGFTLSIPRVTRYGQERQQIVVARGNRYGTIIAARRQNVRGDVVLDPQKMPQGVTMQAEPMPANMTTMPVVFEAAQDAPVEGGLFDFTGKIENENQTLRGRFTNSAILVRGSPGNSTYWSKDVDRLPIAVVDELPFSIDVVVPKAPLVRNGSLGLKVVATRKEGFDEPITLEFPFRPPGVGTVPKVTIPKGKTEATYPLNANGNAPVGEWKVYVLGHANVNGTAYASSKLVPLQIAEPYLEIALERAAVEQGQPVELFGKVTVNTPFEGTAQVKLLGLPTKVTAPDLELTKETGEVTFPLQTDPSSPPGRHKNVFARVIVPQNGESVVHRNVGKTELRIDKPLPKPKKKPKPKKTAEKKPEPEKPKEKRLSRLEMLRLEAEKRRKAAAAAAAEKAQEKSN